MSFHVKPFHVISSGVASVFHKVPLRTTLTAIVLVAGLGAAGAQQGGSRQIQVLPAPGSDQSAPANAAPADAAPPAPAANAAPEPAPAPSPGTAAAPPPPDAPPPVAVAPGAPPEKGPPVKGAPVLVEKPVRPVVKPKPRYHEREYGYQPRYEREYGGGGYGGGGYGGGGYGGGGYGGGGYGGGGYGGSRY